MLHQFFFSLIPFQVFRISGNSMLPTYHPGEKVLVQKKWFFSSIHTGDVVALFHPHTRGFLIKRITKQTKTQVWVEGDNQEESTDSRDFGWIAKKDIIGRVISQKS